MEYAESIVDRIISPQPHDEALAALADALAAEGWWRPAESATSQIVEQSVRDRVLLGLVRASLGHDRWDNVDRLIDDIADRQTRAEALTAAAERAAADGADGRLDDLIDRVLQLAPVPGLAHAIARRDPRRAEALIHRIRNRHERDQQLLSIVTAVAQAGDLNSAEAIADGIDDGYRRAQARSVVAAAAARTDNSEFATTVLSRIAGSDLRDRATLDVVRTAIAAGRELEAERIAATISDPYYLSQALTDLAEAAHSSGDLTRAMLIATDCPTVTCASGS